MGNQRNTARPEIRQLNAAIRAVLKSRGHTYADVAGALGISLATVKRCMSRDQLDLERILEVCDWLQINFYDLVTLSRRDHEGQVVFTRKQELFFAKHPHFLAFYMALRGGRVAPSEVARRFNLSPGSTRTYLAGLERLELLDRLEGDRVKVRNRGDHYRWDDRGPIGQVYTRHFLRSMTERARSSLEDPGQLVLMTGGAMLRATDHAEFRQDLDDLAAKYRHRSQAAKMGTPERRNLVPLSYLFIADVWDDPFFDNVPEI